MALALSSCFAFFSPAHAALQSRAGGSMVYDTDRNITWVADANLFQTQVVANPNLVNQIISNIGQINDTPNAFDTPENSGHHNLSASDFNASTGSMSWFGAQAWTDNLVYGGYSDWRLPTPNPGFYGYNETGSEMGHLFYNELGGVAGHSIINQHNADYNLFNHIQSPVYWAATDYGLVSIYAHVFRPDLGYAGQGDKVDFWYAWAVRDGDVAAVPVPGAFWLLSSVLLGWLGLMRRGNIG